MHELFLPFLFRLNEIGFIAGEQIRDLRGFAQGFPYLRPNYLIPIFTH